jgi:hypothetical protein
MDSIRRRFLGLLGASAFGGFAGCTGQPEPGAPDDDPPDPEPAPETETDTGDGPTDAIPFPGLDSIGFSYDVFTGKYASPEATRVALFDLGDLKPVQTQWGRYSKPDTVHIQKLEGANITATSGTRARDYQTNLASRAGLSGGFGFFRGSLEAEFNEIQRRSTVFNFVTQNDEYNIALLTIDPKGADIRQYVRPHVVEDLETMAPAELFDTYGTHYLRGLIVGAAATYSAATNTTKYSSDVDITTAAEWSYLGATGQEAEANMEVRYREAVQEFRQASTIEVRARGGRAEFAGKILKGSYEDWRDSIEEHMTFASLNDRSLRPIWELLADPARRAELEAAYEAYAGGFDPEPDPSIAPVYGYSVDNPRRWYYSLSRSDMADGGWRLHDEPFFYVSTEPGDDRMPVYRHAAPNPIRYRLSVDPVGRHGWSDETDSDPVWYAYGPDAGDGPDRVAIYGYVDPNNRGTSGWFYNVREEPRGWDREELAFYGDDVDAE